MCSSRGLGAVISRGILILILIADLILENQNGNVRNSNRRNGKEVKERRENQNLILQKRIKKTKELLKKVSNLNMIFQPLLIQPLESTKEELLTVLKRPNGP